MNINQKIANEVMSTGELNCQNGWVIYSLDVDGVGIIEVRHPADCSPGMNGAPHPWVDSARLYIPGMDGITVSR